ncbi:MAG: molybdopterin-dependent oxidoreductase [Anaerolineales bacterium]|nr:molybdopterin-dependent oxidoreductase [Anaerolineales bacterium]
MDNHTVSRRSFLKIGGVGLSALCMSSQFKLEGLARVQSPKQASDTEIVKTHCAFCYAFCGLDIHVKDGKIIKVEGNKDAPHTQGKLCCPKGASLAQFVYNPNRLKYPLKRVGKRGEGKWQRISWDEAYDFIITKLQEIKDKYGPEALAMYRGTGVYSHYLIHLRLFDLYGTPNTLGPHHVCWWPRLSGDFTTFGTPPPFITNDFTNPDVDFANCVVLWGVNSLWGGDHSGSDKYGLLDAAERGAKLIVIDPNFIPMGSKADLWLPIRPGTDGALVYAWINVIISEKLYDDNFLRTWSNGPFLVRPDTRFLLRESDLVEGGSEHRFMVWDENSNSLKYWDVTPLGEPFAPFCFQPPSVLEWESQGIQPELIGSHTVTLVDGTEIECKTAMQMLWDSVKEWTPEKAAEVTWLPADKILESARIYATTKPAALHTGVAMDQSTNSTAVNRGISILRAITGNFDEKGGSIYYMHLGYGIDRPNLLEFEQYMKKIGLMEHPVSGHMGGAEAVYDAMRTGKPYPVRALMTWITNPLVLYPDSNNKYQSLKNLDFYWAQDVVMTPSAEMADIVLPASTWTERYDFSSYTHLQTHGRTIYLLWQPSIKPLWESKPDNEIFGEVMHRMGFGEYWPWKNNEEIYMDHISGLENKEELFAKGFITVDNVYRKYEKGILRPDQKPGLNTPTGKVEIYSERVWLNNSLDVGNVPNYEPLVGKYVEPAESPYSTPELAKQYPLVLTTGSRLPHYFHSQLRSVPWMRELYPVAKVMINPKTVEDYNLGIQNDDWVWVENQRGRIRLKAEVTEAIPPGIVNTPQDSWWFPELPEADPSLLGWNVSNANILTSDVARDPMIGSTQLKGLLCKVYKAEEGAPQGVWQEPKQFKAWLPENSGGK